jgi:hypothetical protein
MRGDDVDDSLPVGAMVGGIVGGLGGLLLLASLAIGFLVMRRRQRRRSAQKLDTEGETLNLQSYTLQTHTVGKRDDMDTQVEKDIPDSIVKAPGNVSCRLRRV